MSSSSASITGRSFTVNQDRRAHDDEDPPRRERDVEVAVELRVDRERERLGHPLQGNRRT